GRSGEGVRLASRPRVPGPAGTLIRARTRYRAGARRWADGPWLRARPHAQVGRIANRPAGARGPARAFPARGGVPVRAGVPIRTVVLVRKRIPGRIRWPGTRRVARPGTRRRARRPGTGDRAITDHRPAGARVSTGPRVSEPLARAAGDRSTIDRARGGRATHARSHRPRTRARGVTGRRGRPGRRRVTSLACRSPLARIPPGSCGPVPGPASAGCRSPRLPGLARRPDRIRAPARRGHP